MAKTRTRTREVTIGITNERRYGGGRGTISFFEIIDISRDSINNTYRKNTSLYFFFCFIENNNNTELWPE